MNNKEFFNNLRNTADEEYDFELPVAIGNRPSSANDVVESLSKESKPNNINVTITINQDLFAKIESLQKKIKQKSKHKISKSRVITKICEEYLNNYIA